MKHRPATRLMALCLGGLLLAGQPTVVCALACTAGRHHAANHPTRMASGHGHDAPVAPCHSALTGHRTDAPCIFAPAVPAGPIPIPDAAAVVVSPIASRIHQFHSAVQRRPTPPPRRS